MASRLAAVPLPACVTRQPNGERGKRGILISHMERNIVKYQQVINLLANGGKNPTTGFWESSYDKTTVIMDALIINKASQPVAEVSEWLGDGSF